MQPAPEFSEYIKEMDIFKKVQDNKYQLEEDIKKYLQETFKSVDYFYFTETSIEIGTEKHSFRYSIYGDPIYKCKPKFICSEKNMPETVEEFIAAKEEIKIDYQDCILAMYYIYDRYKLQEN